MPFSRPSLTGLRNTALQDITSSGVPGLNGLLRQAVLRVLSWVMAGLAYSLYGYADWIARMGVPFTAQDEYLFAWAALVGIYPEPPVGATGTATFYGNPGVTIPTGTAMIRSDGTPYVSTADNTVDVTATVTVPIQATVQAAYTNDPGGTQINIANAIPGINSTGTTGLCTGGADPETNDALRTRMLFRYREPPQGGAAADYIEWALEVPGCTRAWTYTGGAGAGSVVVYPMFDVSEAASGGFPQGTDGGATDETRIPPATGDQLLVANQIWPVQPVTALVYVSAPVPYNIDVTLTLLDPNTQAMQDQIVAALNDMFLLIGQVAGTIYPSDLYEAILATPGINHFLMLTPDTALTAPQGALPVLGTFTAPAPSPPTAADVSVPAA